MTGDEQQSGRNERERDQHHDTDALCHFKMIDPVIVQEDDGCKGQAGNSEQNATGQFPFPGDDQHGQ